MDDNRPIKSDKKYLQSYIENVNKEKQAQKYIKKGSCQVLPCFKQNLKLKQQKLNGYHSSHNQLSQNKYLRKTKAQVYQQIKKKNRQKFGQKSKLKNILNQQEQSKNHQKINLKNMTVSYKPKKPFINTQQYKKPNYKKPQIPLLDQQTQKKVNYDKMMEKVKKQMLKIEKQRQEYKKQVESLKIKNYMIENAQNPIKRSSRISNIQSQLIKTKKSKMSNNQGVMKQNSFQNQNILIESKISENLSNQINNKINVQQSHQALQNPTKINQRNKYKKKLEKCSQKNQQNVNKYIILLEKFNDLRGFPLNQIRQCVDFDNLKYDGNKKYQQAINCKQNCNSFKVKQINQKRITKFQNGWVQVWNPGKQRMMSDQKGYKVTWFGNGDVKQQFRIYGYVKSYFCKAKKVIQITYGENQKIHYFPENYQLQSISNDKKYKQIVFCDGNYQVFDI